MYVKMGPYPKNSERKIEVQIDDYDTWGFDHTIAHIIYPALLQLKATKHGIPCDFVEFGGEEYSDQTSFDFYKEDHDKYFDEGVKKWEETLDKMIWSFEQVAKDNYDDKYHHGTPEYDWEKTEEEYMNPFTGQKEKLFRMVDKNPGEHWYDSDGHLMHEARIQEGLDLFAKYFRNLWD